MKLTHGLGRRWLSCALAAAVAATTVLGGASPAVAAGGISAGAPPGAVATAKPAVPSVVRELEGKRSRFAKHFLLSNGAAQVQIFDSPVNFVDPKTKAYVPIDSALVDTMTAGRKARVNRANAFGVALPDKLTGDWVSLTQGGDRIALRPSRGAIAGEAACSTSAVSATSIDATSVAYDGAFKGADLDYASRADGLKETIVLSRPTSSTAWGFDLALDGLTPRAENDGSISLVHAHETTPAFTIPKPCMWDSSQDATSIDTAYTDNVHYVLSGAAPTYHLDVVADAAWLSDPARVYPVRIDPGIQTWGAACGEDTYVTSLGGSQGTNFVHGIYVYVAGTSPTQYAYIKPPTDPLISGAKADLEQVLSATLNLRCYQTAGNGVVAYRISSWGSATPTNLTWANHAAVGAAPMDGQTAVVPVAKVWNAWNVTDAADQWCRGVSAPEGFEMRMVTQSGSASFNARDAASQVPYLNITYGSKPQTTLGAMVESQGELPRASWSYSDEFGNPQTGYSIEVATSLGGDPVGSTGWVSSGATNAPVPAPAGGWVAGQTYWIHARTRNQPQAGSAIDGPWCAWASYTPKLLTPIADVSASTTTSAGWWSEAAGNDDSQTTGRGSVALSWSPVPGATGYDVYLWDGATYRVVGTATGAGWSSAGKGLYPSDSVIASRSDGATSSPFLASGGFDLRDDPRALYAKCAGPSSDATLAYSFRVSPRNALGALPATANAECLVALESRTVHLQEDPRHAVADLGGLFGDDAAVRLDEGDFVLHATDLSIPGLGADVSVERVYRSSSLAQEMSSPGWRFTFQRHVVSSGNEATYFDEDSDAHVFTKAGGAWVAPRGDTDGLVGDSTSGYTLSHKDLSTTRFDASGRLESECDPNGNAVRYEWATDGSSLTIHSPKDVWLLHERRITVSFDSSGRATSAVARVGGGDADRVVTYDPQAASLTVVRLPGTNAAQTTSYRYDASSRVSAVAVPGFTPSASGEAVWSVSYGSAGTSLCVANETGASTPRMPRTVTWNGASGTATIASASGTQSVAFDPLGQEVSRTEENTTAATTAGYDADGNCIREVSPTGRTTTRSFDSRGNVLSETDEIGATTRYTYSRDLCVHELDARGSDTSRTYDAAGNLLAEEKTLNDAGDRSRVDYDYNADGSLSWSTTMVDATHTAEIDYEDYDDSGLAEKTTNVGVELSDDGPPQNLVTHVYRNGFGEQTSARDALGTTTRTDVLDAAGRVVQTIDASGTATNTRYDALGDSVESWRSNDASPGLKVDWSATQYDGAGDVVTETVKASDGATISTTVHQYDAAGREIKADNSSVPGAEVTQYDAQSNVATTWDEGMDASDTVAATRATYDGEGEQTAETDPGARSASTVTSYTADGQVDGEIGPDGSVTDYGYDDAGDLATASVGTDVGEADTAYETDLDGRTTDVVDSNDTTTTTTYDLDGNEIGARLGDQNVTTTRVNTLGWTLKTTDFDGVVTTSTYDADGREVRTSTGGLVTSKEYDDCGRVSRQLNADGSAVTYSYDPFGRQTVSRDTVGALTLGIDTTEYDSAGRVSRSSEATSLSTAAAGRARTFTYATDGTVATSETRRGGDAALTTSADGTGLMRFFSATFAGRPIDWSVLSTDLAGRVTASTSAALPVSRTATYTEAGQLRDTTLGFASAVYSYSDVSGKKTHDSLAFRFPGRGEETTYSYDDTGRVTSASTGGVATTYSYDSETGALSAYRRGVAATVTLSYEADGMGRLTSAGSRVFRSDSLGRRLRVGPAANASETAYGWTADRLTSLTTTATRATYTYDASGQRLRSVLSTGSSTSTTTDFDYDGTRLLGTSGSRSDGTTWTIDYLYDECGRPFAGVYASSASTATPFLIETTDRGDVRELLDSTGAAFAYYAYDAFGVPTDSATRATSLVPAATAAAIGARQVLRYASYAYDAESGLYYCSQRYYDPSVAAFISKDPAKADGEESPYQYCAGNPVGSSDPSGLDSPKDSLQADAYGTSWWKDTKKPSKKKHNARHSGRRSGGSGAGSAGIYRHYTPSQYARIRSRIIQNARTLKAWKIRYSQGDQLPKKGGQLDCSGAVGWVLHRAGLSFVNGPSDATAGRWTTNEFYSHLGLVGGTYGGRGYTEKRFSAKRAWRIGDVIVTRHGQGSNHVVVIISDGPNPQVFESRGSKNGAYIGPLSARLATWHGKVSGRFFGLE